MHIRMCIRIRVPCVLECREVDMYITFTHARMHACKCARSYMPSSLSMTVRTHRYVSFAYEYPHSPFHPCSRAPHEKHIQSTQQHGVHPNPQFQAYSAIDQSQVQPSQATLPCRKPPSMLLPSWVLLSKRRPSRPVPVRSMRSRMDHAGPHARAAVLDVSAIALAERPSVRHCCQHLGCAGVPRVHHLGSRILRSVSAHLHRRGSLL